MYTNLPHLVLAHVLVLFLLVRLVLDNLAPLLQLNSSTSSITPGSILLIIYTNNNHNRNQKTLTEQILEEIQTSPEEETAQANTKTETTSAADLWIYKANSAQHCR